MPIFEQNCGLTPLKNTKFSTNLIFDKNPRVNPFSKMVIFQLSWNDIFMV